MKKLILIPFFLFIVATSFAQTDQQSKIEQRVQHAKEQLSLSSTQFNQWVAIYEKYDKEMKVAMQNRNRSEMKHISLKKEEELLGTLNESQKTKYKEWKESQKKDS